VPRLEIIKSSPNVLRHDRVNEECFPIVHAALCFDVDTFILASAAALRLIMSIIFPINSALIGGERFWLSRKRVEMNRHVARSDEKIRIKTE
jgi:hypothetical protein